MTKKELLLDVEEWDYELTELCTIVSDDFTDNYMMQKVGLAEMIKEEEIEIKSRRDLACIVEALLKVYEDNYSKNDKDAYYYATIAIIYETIQKYFEEGSIT